MLTRESRDKMRELQAILFRVSSLRNGRGGDVFFRTLAKTFQAYPITPPDDYYLKVEKPATTENTER